LGDETDKVEPSENVPAEVRGKPRPKESPSVAVPVPGRPKPDASPSAAAEVLGSLKLKESPKVGVEALPKPAVPCTLSPRAAGVVDVCTVTDDFI